MQADIVEGTLRVTPEGISITVIRRDCQTMAGSQQPHLTVEEFMANAWHLAHKLRLPYADPSMEARRIARLDQLEATVKDMVADAVRRLDS